MNISEYETIYIGLYREFCQTIRDILVKAIAAEQIPRPQSIQCREKEPKRLRARLEQVGLIDSDTIETVRRDLSGARIIFYTDTDVERFIGSRLIQRNFEVEDGSVKIHYPTKENNEQQYRGTHFTVRLKDDRTALPEYAKFKGLRCEVQVQTVLQHAWSETSHDILYKTEPRPGFGTHAMESIESRFNRVMVRYLIPAGYEFQRIQHDYERLQQGKELFDRNLLERLSEATDNNERFDIITSLRDDVLPQYDDISAIYPDVLPALVATAKKAKETPVSPRVLPFGTFEGRSDEDVLRAVIETIDRFRNADIVGSFDALRELYPND